MLGLQGSGRAAAESRRSKRHSPPLRRRVERRLAAVPSQDIAVSRTHAADERSLRRTREPVVANVGNGWSASWWRWSRCALQSSPVPATLRILRWEWSRRVTRRSPIVVVKTAEYGEGQVWWRNTHFPRNETGCGSSPRAVCVPFPPRLVVRIAGSLRSSSGVTSPTRPVRASRVLPAMSSPSSSAWRQRTACG
jgi:hypothetical protein